MKYIDIHGHINIDVYDSDREEVMSRAKGAGIGVVVVGDDLESSVRGVEIAESNDEVWATVGTHPTHASSPFAYDQFMELAKRPKVVAIGECGLDYFHSQIGDVARQKEIFVEHIKLANEVGKPLMLHVRNTSTPGDGRNAYRESIRILREHSRVPANFHFFAGSLGDLHDVIEIGCSVSFTGVITFTRDYDALVKAVPIDRMMSETDCPFVAPIPYRGERCEPIHVIEVIKHISRIRGESEEYISQNLLQNAKKFFSI